MTAITTKVLFSLFAQCASDVAPETLYTLIGVESSRNPYAIAVVYAAIAGAAIVLGEWAWGIWGS